MSESEKKFNKKLDAMIAIIEGMNASDAHRLIMTVNSQYKNKFILVKPKID